MNKRYEKPESIVVKVTLNELLSASVKITYHNEEGGESHFAKGFILDDDDEDNLW